MGNSPHENLIKDQLIVSRGRYDNEFFIDFFLGHHKRDKKTGKPIKSADFHIDMINSMKKESNLNIVFPRDHAKTTNSLFDTVQDICYELEPLTILVAGEGLGVEFISKVRDEFLNNDRIKHYFGNLVPLDSGKRNNNQWTSKKIQFMNGCELQTISRGGKIRGKRPTKLKVDDPQENKDVKNPKIADEFIDWFFTSVYNTLDPNGRCIVIGTVISENCFVNVLEQQDRGFKTIKYPAVIDPIYEYIPKGEIRLNQDGEEIEGRGRKHLVGGRPIRGAKWSLKALDDRMQVIGWDTFQQEYQHEPMLLAKNLVINSDVREGLKVLRGKKDWSVEGLLIFKPSGNEETDAQGVTTVKESARAVNRFSIGVDTSAGGENGDFSAIVVRNNAKELFATYYARTAPDMLCRVIQRLWDLGYYPKTKALGIEVNNTGLVTITEARNYDNGKGYVWYNYIYQKEVYDEKTQKTTKKVGRETNGKTRPLMFEDYKKWIINEQVLDEIDERIEKEMKTLIYNDNGREEALKPYHDDIIIADAISCQMTKVNKFILGADL